MRRPTLLVIFFTVFVDLIGFGLVLPLLPNYSKNLGATGFEVGVIISSYSLMQFLFAPSWGRLSDRIQRRKILAFGVFFWSLLTALWYAQTPEADRAIASLETSSSVSAEVKTFAKELLKRNVEARASGVTAQLPTEGAIRSARVDAMKDISDEAIDEVQRLTLQLVLRRRSPEPDSSVSQTAVEAAIFRALMRDFAVPGREKYRKQTPPSVISVDPENLRACPTNPAEIVHGCVLPDILASARLEAARGSWSLDLVSDH